MSPLLLLSGRGVDITKPFGNLIVDIGAGTTDVAVVSVGGVVVFRICEGCRR